MSTEEKIEKCIENIIAFKTDRNTAIDEEYLESLRTDLIPLTDLEEKMEQINQLIGRAMLTETPSIQGHIDYMLGKGVQFSDRRFECLFVDYNKLPTQQQTKQSEYEKSESGLDYSYREKMAGFLAVPAALEWDKEKIRDFIESIKNI